MEYVLIEIDSDEWNIMWDWLEKHPINNGLAEPSIVLNNNEKWEYIGSFKNKEVIIHEFRHRCHPYNNELIYLRLNGTKNLDQKNIRKKFKL